MSLPSPPPPGGRVLVLSGAGLSAASGVPTFRGAGGLWEGQRVEDVATPEAWYRDRDAVRRFYDGRRIGMGGVAPNAGHEALVRLQRAWGADRVALVTQNIDGLLSAAGAEDVLEMHGSIRHLRCEADEEHPWVPIQGAQDRDARCRICGAWLRPAVVWFGEIPLQMDRIGGLLQTCHTFLSVGTSGLVYPAAGFVRVARQLGARTIEVNPEPSGDLFHVVVAEGAEVALPRLVEHWLS